MIGLALMMATSATVAIAASAMMATVASIASAALATGTAVTVAGMASSAKTDVSGDWSGGDSSTGNRSVGDGSNVGDGGSGDGGVAEGCRGGNEEDTRDNCGGCGGGNISEAVWNPRRKLNASVAFADRAGKPRPKRSVSTDARAINIAQ